MLLNNLGGIVRMKVFNAFFLIPGKAVGDGGTRLPRAPGKRGRGVGRTLQGLAAFA